MSFICKLFRKKTEVKDEIDLSQPAKWTVEELQLFDDVNQYRFDKNKHYLKQNNDMKVLSQGRVKWWETHKTPNKELHFGFLRHAQIYLDKDYKKIAENVQAGYRNILRAYQLSESHNASILSDEWRFIAITIKKFDDGRNRVCLILSK